MFLSRMSWKEMNLPSDVTRWLDQMPQKMRTCSELKLRRNTYGGLTFLLLYTANRPTWSINFSTQRTTRKLPLLTTTALALNRIVRIPKKRQTLLKKTKMWCIRRYWRLVMRLSLQLWTSRSSSLCQLAATSSNSSSNRMTPSSNYANLC